MPRVTQDFDFKIHEDVSSLGAPMEDDVPSDNHEIDSTESSFAEDAGEAVEEQEQEQEPNKPLEIVDPPREEELHEDAWTPEPSESNDAQGGELDDSVVSQQEEEDETPVATEIHEDDEESLKDSESRRQSSATDRRASGRTEALIQAAARAVVARIEKNRNHSDLHPSIEEDDQDADASLISHTTDETDGVEGADSSYAAHSEASPRPSDAYTYSEASPRASGSYTHSEASPRQSDVHPHSGAVPRVSEGHMLPAPGDEAGGDSSSHHEADDDVFSDDSPRSSMGSLSSDPDQKQNGRDETLTQATRSPRISEISQYDKEDFVPTVRGTPRLPFRTPSDVRAMQMSSPPASVYGSPRSSKRPPLPTISRLGSPSVSAQYSPKRRSTPPRFKSRKEAAPLVLLHVTLLPLRWPWAGVLEAADNHQLSESAKTLRDNWRQLQDRMGDTVLERGVLLPHPQNDYEVLEERVLEAMELPLRRRARILECGHYLGPANEMNMSDDVDSGDEDFDTQSMRDGMDKKTHWCTTCRHEIKYDSLGAGKIFRVKVYASNGLMKAGAWEACWKEMERVDIELEPIVEPPVAEELGRLAAEQQAREEEEQRMVEQQLEEHHGDHDGHGGHEVEEHHMESSRMTEPDIDTHGRSMLNHGSSPRILSSPPARHMHMASPRTDTERRRREEERLREIYGHTPPPPHTQQQSPRSSSSMGPHPDSYIPPPSPPSPSEQAFERRQTRRKSYQTASLPELLLEAVKVVLQDRKNVVIAILSFLALCLAVRGGQGEEPHNHFPAAVRHETTTIAAQNPIVEAVEDLVVSSVSIVSSMSSVLASSDAATVVVEASIASDVPSVESAEAPPPPQVKEPQVQEPEVKEPEPEPESAEPCTSSEPQTETVTSREVVRVVETVTKTVEVTTTATATATEVERETPTQVREETKEEAKVEETPAVKADPKDAAVEAHEVKDDVDQAMEVGEQAETEAQGQRQEIERDEL